MNTKNNFMLRAIELSMNSANNDGGPFGCVITKENEIIAEGSNKVTFLMILRHMLKWLQLEKHAKN